MRRAALFGAGKITWQLQWQEVLGILGGEHRRTKKDEKERSDKNGNMAFKVHKMAVIRALLLRFNGWNCSEKAREY